MDLNLLSEKQAQTLDNMLRAANHIVIVGHSRPDGDALGSCLSWANYLTVHYGKQPVVIVPNAYPDFLHWLPGSEQIVRYDKHPDKVKQYLDEADLLCCLDFNQLSRVDDMADLLTACKAQRLLFDHHLGAYIDAAVQVSYPELSSTSEIVFRVVWQLGGFDELGKMFAVPDYCGMMTDTEAASPTTLPARRFTSLSASCSPRASTKIRFIVTSSTITVRGPSACVAI